MHLKSSVRLNQVSWRLKLFIGNSITCQAPKSNTIHMRVTDYIDIVSITSMQDNTFLLTGNIYIMVWNVKYFFPSDVCHA